MKIKALLAVAFCSSILFTGSVSAVDTLLAREVLELSEGKATAELWGDKLPNGYANNLLILLKDKDKKIITAYKPSIKGGYNCLTYVVASGSGKFSELLLSAGQGDWRAPSEYRVISFADTKNVQEVFGASESMGVVTDAYIKKNKLQVKLLNENVENVNLEQGVKVDDGQVNFGGLHSLMPWDADNDGVDELFSSQRLVQGKTPLADIGVVWKRDKENKKWEICSKTIMTLGKTSKDNTVNDGLDFAAGTILPRRVVVSGGEATFPVFTSKNLDLQEKVNKALWLPNTENLEMFYAGKADTAFKVLRATKNLLSVELISGKTQFRHQYVNINMQTGELIKLAEILNAKDKDLLPLLNVLCTNKKIKFADKLPDEWYVEDNNLFLIQNVNGQEEVAGFNLGNLHKFILNKQILE